MARDDLEKALSEAQAQLAAARADVEKAQARATAAEEQLAERPAPPAPPADPVEAALAAVPEAHRAVLEAELRVARESAASERARAAELEQARQLATFVSAAAAYACLPVEPKAFGPVLQACQRSLSAEHYAELTRVLTAADEQARDAGILKERGASGGVDDTRTAAERLDTLTKEALAKGEAKSHAKAYAMVVERHPELVARMNEERREALKKGA